MYVPDVGKIKHPTETYKPGQTGSHSNCIPNGNFVLAVCRSWRRCCNIYYNFSPPRIFPWVNEWKKIIIPTIRPVLCLISVNSCYFIWDKDTTSLQTDRNFRNFCVFPSGRYQINRMDTLYAFYLFRIKNDIYFLLISFFQDDRMGILNVEAIVTYRTANGQFTVQVLVFRQLLFFKVRVSSSFFVS